MNIKGTLRVAGTIGESITDGPGLRYVVLTQGCPHGCPGCIRPETHDGNGGMELKLDTLLADILKNPLLGGVTFTGGEPFCQAAPLHALAAVLKERGMGVMAYTGYTYEQLLTMGGDALALLSQCDLLVDGPYIQSLRDVSLRFRHSRNQRLLDVPQSLKAGQPVLAKGYLQMPS